MLISLTEYARRHGKDPSTVRLKAEEGRLEGAQKVGRNWIIDSETPYTDYRRKAQNEQEEQV